jgi:hypothetical protein
MEQPQVLSFEEAKLAFGLEGASRERSQNRHDKL